MIFKLFLESLLSYPKGTLLILIALLNLFWISYVLFANQKYKNQIFKIYFFYAVFALLWVITNAYFQSGLLFVFGEEIAMFMAIAANIASSFALIGFYWLASVIKNPGKRLFSHSRFFVFSLMIILAFRQFSSGA